VSHLLLKFFSPACPIPGAYYPRTLFALSPIVFFFVVDRDADVVTVDALSVFFFSFFSACLFYMRVFSARFPLYSLPVFVADGWGDLFG